MASDPNDFVNQLEDSLTEQGDRFRRVRKIEELLATPATTRDIVLQIVAEFGVGERCVYFDLKAAYARLSEMDALEHAERKNRARLRWERRLAVCEEKGDQSAANVALDRLCKLDGLYEPIRVQASGFGNNTTINVLVMTPHQRLARIEELRARLPQPVLGSRDPIDVDDE